MPRVLYVYGEGYATLGTVDVTQRHWRKGLEKLRIKKNSHFWHNMYFKGMGNMVEPRCRVILWAVIRKSGSQTSICARTCSRRGALCNRGGIERLCAGRVSSHRAPKHVMRSTPLERIRGQRRDRVAGGRKLP